MTYIYNILGGVGIILLANGSLEEAWSPRFWVFLVGVLLINVLFADIGTRLRELREKK